MKAIIIYLLRMGLLSLLTIINVAAATDVFTRSDTGTAFIQSPKSADFYQDTVETTINVQIYSPRIMLDYTAYTACDLTLQINGFAMCDYQFSEFDTKTFEFLDLDLVKTKNQHMKSTTPSYTNEYLRAKNDSVAALELQVKIEQTARGNITNGDRRRRSTKTRKTSREGNRAQWTAIVEHTQKHMRKELIALCAIGLLPNMTNVDQSPDVTDAAECVANISAIKFPESIMFANRELQIDLKNIFVTWFEETADEIRVRAEERLNDYSTLTDFFYPSLKRNRLLEVENLRTIANNMDANAEVLKRQVIKTEQSFSVKRNRSKRGAGLLLGAGLISVGTAVAGYFIGDAQSDIQMQQVREDLKKHNQAILDLNLAVQISENSIADVASMLKIEPSLVLTGETSLPFDINFESTQVKEGNMNTRYDVANALHISRLNSAEYIKMQNYVLNLQNSRLPLDKTFLLALRAECLALQEGSSPRETRFCNDFAFHSTRWDSGLAFNGIGLTYIDQDETMIESIIYSLTTTIPILYEDNLEQMDIINLGKFQSPEVIKRITLPTSSVITKSGVIHPFNKKRCIELTSSLVCPTKAIDTYDPCLHAIYSGTISESCDVEKIPSQTTCIGEIMEKFAIVTLSKPALVHYDVQKNRHMHSTQSIQEFGIVNRTTVNGAIFCETSSTAHVPPELQIPRRKTTTSNYTVEVIFTTSDHMTKMNTSEDRLQSLETIMHKQSEKLSTSTKKLNDHHHNTNSTIHVFKEKMKTALSTVPSKIKSGIYDFLLPIFTPIAAIAITAFIILVGLSFAFNRLRRSVSKIPKRSQKYTIPMTDNDQHDSRTEDSVV